MTSSLTCTIVWPWTTLEGHYCVIIASEAKQVDYDHIGDWPNKPEAEDKDDEEEEEGEEKWREEKRRKKK